LKIQSVIIFSVAAFAVAARVSGAGEAIRFNRDVLPILSDKCFHCHGPDAGSRKAGLRLDEEAFLKRGSESGLAIVKAGDPDGSELCHRVGTTDADEVMPPPNDAKQLTAGEKEILFRWVKEGAAWQGHWAFEPVTRPPLPSARVADDPIDAFILARLDREGIAANPPADPSTWLRRAALDLTGLPPDPGEVARFLADRDHRAAVDRLLASPRYGERMAWDWLEAARYADTHGYQKDNLRSMWAWRDWVVKAFNANQPFDQFTIEQLAGDLLPSPSTEQLVATGFNRNHRINAEAGAIGEEYRTEYVIDRVDTTATVWMGLTAGCARCHDHKFDPLTQREFFALAAFFNNIDEKGADGAGLTAAPDLAIAVPGFEKAIEERAENLTKTETGLREKAASLAADHDRWLDRQRTILDGGDYWLVTEPATVKGDSPDSTFTTLPDRSILFGGTNPLNDTHRLFVGTSHPLRVGAIRLEALPHPDLTGGSLSRSFNGDFLLSELVVRHRGKKLALTSAQSTVASPGRSAGEAIDGDPLSGWSVGGGRTGPASAIFTLAETMTLVPGDEVVVELAYLSREEQYSIGRFRVSLAVGEPDEAELTQTLRSALLSGERDLLAREFREGFPGLNGLRRERDLARESLEAARTSASTRVMVMRERPGPPRPTHVLTRGLYDQPGEPVTPDVPRFLRLPLPSDAKRDRLALASWLVNPRHPLTARVIVNRLWQQFFGTGLVASPEDFGRQGAQPSHPELLDFLASEFVAGGWDVKALVRRIVLTDAYRRSSAMPVGMIERDPRNLLLARGPRKRLPAPAIRDQALFAGGLLAETMGGPPVRPPQPAGLWEAVAGVNSNTTRYVPDRGEGRFRRSLYTLWKRGVPPPNLLLFDASARETCSVGRENTNTPLQALVTLNDPNFSFAALAFARRETAAALDDRSRIARMWKRLLVREPSDAEIGILLVALKDHRARYAADPALARERSASAADPVELASWTEIAEILLNLDLTLSPP
jgi:hypothetical protein